ncbi:unnamed protein product, partial [Brassica rapa subsp. trilocularis]
EKSLKKLISSFLLILSPTTIVNLSEPPSVRYKSIIRFGDSSADTGNFLSLSYDINHPPQAAFLPYGETFFHPPSRRYFDGRLIIDFIAEFLGLPYVPPYFGSKSVSFDQGVNFAVYGATALDRALLVEKGIKSDFNNVSLSVQLNIFKKFFPNLCASSSRDCREVFGDSLILMGEIGVNDYSYPFFEGESINAIKELVPLVIKAISSASVELIDLGGKTFLVPGNFPFGCFQRIVLYLRPRKRNTSLLQVVSHGSTTLESTIMNSLRQNLHGSKSSTLMSASFTPTTTTLCTRFSKNQPNTGSRIDLWLLVVVLEVNTTSLLMKNVDPKELVTVKIHLSVLIGMVII